MQNHPSTSLVLLGGEGGGLQAERVTEMNCLEEGGGSSIMPPSQSVVVRSSLHAFVRYQYGVSKPCNALQRKCYVF